MVARPAAINSCETISNCLDAGPRNRAGVVAGVVAVLVVALFVVGRVAVDFAVDFAIDFAEGAGLVGFEFAVACLRALFEGGCCGGDISAEVRTTPAT